MLAPILHHWKASALPLAAWSVSFQWCRAPLLAFIFALISLTPISLAAQPTPPAQTQPARSGSGQSAQNQPRISLNTLKPTAGEQIVIIGSGFPAGSQVTARLTAPNGSVTRESTRVEDNGHFRIALALPSAGDYTLVVRGQGLDQMRQLEVQRVSDLPARTPAPNTPQGQNSGGQSSGGQAARREGSGRQNIGAQETPVKDRPKEQLEPENPATEK